MNWPRPRCTVRWLMTAVAIAGTVFTYERWVYNEWRTFDERHASPFDPADSIFFLFVVNIPLLIVVGVIVVIARWPWFPTAPDPRGSADLKENWDLAEGDRVASRSRGPRPRA